MVKSPSIASGSFKTVFRGQLKRLPGTTSLLEPYMDVAVMELRSGGDELEAEAKILVRLAHHPRLVRYIGMCTERDRPCLITEFAPMGSISDAMPRIEGDLSAAHELAITLQISSGMEMLSSEGLVHRDLALRNVLLFGFDKYDVSLTSVKVSDFGLTVHTHGRTHMTVESNTRPTRWLAPESILRQQYSTQSDVWAFGITALELSTRGMVPYILECPTEKDVIEYVGRDKKMPKRPTDTALPCADAGYDKLWELMESCWSFHPRDRPSFAQLTVKLGCMPTPETDNFRSVSSSPSLRDIPGDNPTSSPATSNVSTASGESPREDIPAEKLFVLKASGKRVSMLWLFENGYSKADCEPEDTLSKSDSTTCASTNPNLTLRRKPQESQGQEMLPTDPVATLRRKPDRVEKIKAPMLYGYESSAPVYTCGTAIPPNAPIYEGEHVTFRMVPNMPAGLVLNGTTGVLTGTPKWEGDATGGKLNRVIIAENGSGSAQVDLAMTFHSGLTAATLAMLSRYRLSLPQRTWKCVTHYLHARIQTDAQNHTHVLVRVTDFA